MAKGGYGNFGILSDRYDEARQNFPDEVLGYLWSKVRVITPSVLDLGCGTGISSRQLAAHGAVVTGADKDRAMIRVARSKHTPRIHYVVAPVEKLPFDDEEFDVLTAFSAFHWFATPRALLEVKRVLKPNGLFFVANKNDVGGFRQGYQSILRRFINKALPDIKRNYDPESLLKGSDFTDIEKRTFEAKEFFAVPQAVSYLQSVSVWNLVPARLKSVARHSITEYCEMQTVDGKIERRLEVITVLGKKPKQ